jgi:DNA-directed RNA polymerase subunit RPC12/RpoP
MDSKDKLKIKQEIYDLYQAGTDCSGRVNAIAKRVVELVEYANYQCVDCGKKFIRPFENGDKNTRCEECAVRLYKTGR